MKKLLLTAALLIAAAGCRTVYDSYTHPLAEVSSLKRVCLLPFKDLGGGGVLAQEMILDSLTLELLSRGAFEVVSADEVREKLQIADLNSLDTSKLNRIKEVLGCDAAITGTINYFGQGEAKLDLVMKLLDAESGVIIWMGNAAYSGKTDLPTFGIGETTSIKILIKRAVADLVKGMMGRK